MDLKDKLISSFPSFEEKNEAQDSIKYIRKSALKNFESKGFPTKREELWRFTSLRPILKNDYELFPEAETILKLEDIKQYFGHDLDAHRLIFIDGCFAPDLSKTTEDVIDVCPLSSALKEEKYSAVIEDHFNEIAPEEDSLSNLNTAFSREGAFIYIKDKVTADKPVQVLHFSTGTEKAMMVQPRNLVVVGEN